MNKIFYLVLFAMVMVSCSKSKEQKAEALVKESVKKVLFKPETYKPVETKVDSAFAPYDDPGFFKELAELEAINSDYEELVLNAKHAKSSMSIWSGPYQTSFGRNEYQEAKGDYEEANAKIEKLKKKGRKQYEKVVQLLQASPKFIGYKVVHSFRADNNDGDTLMGEFVFIIDKNFEEIIYSMEAEGYNQAQKAISSFMEQLEEVDE